MSAPLPSQSTFIGVALALWAVVVSLAIFVTSISASSATLYRSKRARLWANYEFAIGMSDKMIPLFQEYEVAQNPQGRNGVTSTELSKLVEQ